MENHEIYQSAMDKITPSEDWQKDTLAKLASARAEMEQAENKASGKNEKTPKHSAKNLKLWKQVGLPLAAAAVFALVLIPAVIQNSHSADLVQLKEGTGVVAALPPQNDSAQPYGASADTDSLQDNAAKSVQPAETVNGLPVIHWFKEISGRGGTWEFLAAGPEALVTKNPTFNLPSEQMPKTLPVWAAPAGENAAPLLQRLESAAQHTGLTLALPEFESCPDGYPAPELWPSYYAGKLMDPATYRPDLPLWEQLEPALWNVSASLQSLNFSSTGLGYSEGNSPVSEQMTRIGCEMANNQLGKKMVGIEHPAYQSYSSVNYWGEPLFESYQNFLYEAGDPSDDLQTRLLNYSFKRVYGSLNPSGTLDTAMFTFPPESEPVGIYPIRSVEEAKAALDSTLDEDRAHNLIDYGITSDDIVNWRIEYYRSPLNGYILPLYVFNLETPLQPGETAYRFEGASLYTVYVEYWVSALPDEYCVESLENRY